MTDSDARSSAPEDTSTNYFFYEDREALVLAGGGARGAYQVGVLRALAEWMPPDTPCPFDVLVGTSAGAVNAAALAARAANLTDAVHTLESVWSRFKVEQVVRADNLSMLIAGLRWMLALASGGRLVAPPRALLDTSPLRDLIAAEIPVGRIRQSIAAGHIKALAVATTSYSTGRAVAFFEGVDRIEGWNRVRRGGVRRSIDLDVLMASAAIPFIFPSVRVDGDHYGDGAMRQLAPLSPAVHLGANRMLVVGTRVQSLAPADCNAEIPPSPGHLLGFVLDSLFTDGLSIDLERLRQVNELLIAGGTTKPGHRPIDVLVIQPSMDPVSLARKHVDRMPRSIRMLLGAIGALEARGGLLLSYLLFDSSYTRELMRLGQADARARKSEILGFLRAEPSLLESTYPGSKQYQRAQAQ
jgi:NTE family protein